VGATPVEETSRTSGKDFEEYANDLADIHQDLLFFWTFGQYRDGGEEFEDEVCQFWRVC